MTFTRPTTNYETTAQTIADLSPAAVSVVPVDRDWSEGYAETWEYVEAPCCGCGDYARHADGHRALELAGIDLETLREQADDAAERASVAEEEGDHPEEIASEQDTAEQLGQRVADLDVIDAETWSTWRCVDPACDDFGQEVDPHEGGAEGPMMNYAYPLPDGRDFDAEDADALRDLPLCIVIDQGSRYGHGDTSYSLALTGGGMDLSWEIAEAFVRLGYLPPAHFAALPGMAGRGGTAQDHPGGSVNVAAYEAYEARRVARDRHLIAACRASAADMVERAQAQAANITRSLDMIEGR